MFKNLHELIKQMPDEATCRAYLASQRWADGIVVCPYCEGRGAYVIEGGKRYKCKSSTCYKKFSVTVGTVFEASNVPLTKWFMAVYILSGHKKGLSSYQLGRDIGVSQKTAWFMLHRIREVFGLKDMPREKLSGTIEVDETYMSRKFASDYKGIPPEKAEAMMEAKPRKKSGVVVGLAERDGDIRVVAHSDMKADEIKKTITTNVATGSTIYTDEARMYKNGIEGYKHDSVNHSAGQWVKFDVTTNHVENFWSVMRRGVYGIYHQISYKHLQRYCDEYSFRYNTRKLCDSERFIYAMWHVTGRLDYKTLTGKK